jgi:hypothetical protein
MATLQTHISPGHRLDGIDLERACATVSIDPSYVELAIFVPAHSLKSMIPSEAAIFWASLAIKVLS